MNVEAQKLEIIEWLLKLKDDSAIKEVLKVKKTHPRQKRAARKFGGGKNIFTYVAEDFDEPLPDFKEYMK
jgi:hypothetical protein